MVFAVRNGRAGAGAGTGAFVSDLADRADEKFCGPLAAPEGPNFANYSPHTGNMVQRKTGEFAPLTSARTRNFVQILIVSLNFGK